MRAIGWFLSAMTIVTGACSSSEDGTTGGAPATGGSPSQAGSTGEGGQGGVAVSTVCNSGFEYHGDDLSCLSDACCDAFNDCTLDAKDVEGCIECLVAGSGERCEAVIACKQTQCTPVEGEPVCDSGVLVDDPELAACLTRNCCEEFVACSGNGEMVGECQACLARGGGPLCDAVIECQGANCGGPVGSICDSGLAVSTASQGECLSVNCCAEFDACSDQGANVDACIDCFNDGGGPLCDDAIACSAANCPTGACDSGLSYDDPALNICMSASCCEQANVCTDGGNDPDACITCLDEGGGLLCDDYIACFADFCG